MTIPSNHPNHVSSESSDLPQAIQTLEQRVAAQDQELRDLRGQIEMYTQMLDAIPDMVVCKGPHARILYANKAFCDYYAMSVEQLRHLSDAPFTASGQYSSADEATVFSSGQTLDIPEEPLTRYDGHVASFHTVTSPIFDAAGQVMQVVSVSRNMSERHQAEQALRATEARLQRLTNSVPGMVYEFVLYPDGTVAFPFVSAGSQAIYSLTPQEIQADATRIISVIHPDDQAAFQTSVLQSAATLTPWQWEGRVVLPSGEAKWLQAASQPQRQSDGSTIWHGLLLDISERKRGEEERARLQDALIEAQAATVAELSTPLIPLTADVLVMPLIGAMDSRRAQQILDVLLHGLTASRKQIAIIDITGVPVVDTHVANTFIRAARAVHLLGAQVVLTGIRPEVAQTLVQLGVDLSGVVTQSTLENGITYALARRGRGSGNRAA